MSRPNQVRPGTSRSCLGIAAAICASAAAVAGGGEPADIDGSRDHPLVPRYPGATIYDFTVRERDVAAFAVGGPRIEHAEGRFTLVRYRYPPGTPCQAILRKHEASLRQANLDVRAGTVLPDEAARAVGGAPVEGWVTGVGGVTGGGAIHVLAACSASGLAPSGSVLVVESRPLAMRGRSAPRPVFDTAPTPLATAELPRGELAELVFRCPPRVEVQVGPVAPVDMGEGAADASMGAGRWEAHFAPPAVAWRFSLSGSAMAGGLLVCSYGRQGEPAGQSVSMSRPVPPGQTCTHKPAIGEFKCRKR
jgi:hypothetical protein